MAPIAVFTDDFITDFAEAARCAAELGVQGLAVRNVQGRNISLLDADEVRELKRTADAHALSISALGSPYGRGFFLDEPGSERVAEELLAKMIHYAELLGTSRIRIFAPWLRGHDAYEMWTDRPDYDLHLDELADRLTPSLRMARSAGVTLMVETEGASFVGQAREARLLIERVGADALALCWDVANAWRSGEEPLQGWAEARRVPIADVHVKDLHADERDPRRAGTGRARAGEGDVPYRRLLHELVESGYDGYFTAERNYHPRRPEAEPELSADVHADLRNLHAMVADIDGGRT